MECSVEKNPEYFCRIAAGLEICMIIRNHYMAQIKSEYLCDGEGSVEVEAAAEECRACAEKLIGEGRLLTAALYHYRNMLFLYYEEVREEDDAKEKKESSAVKSGECQESRLADLTPDAFMGALEKMLEKWPKDGTLTSWIKMFHIYYHNEPKSVDQWQQGRQPEHRRGRIAKLREDKLFEYVYHHVAIVNEGLLTGDKYQSIALYGDLLFSYFEEPKKLVNIKEDYEHESQAINDWLAVDPESHFIPFPEANGSNFYIIPEYFAVGTV